MKGRAVKGGVLHEGTPPSVTKRTVRILLECILIFQMYMNVKNVVFVG